MADPRGLLADIETGYRAIHEGRAERVIDLLLSVVEQAPAIAAGWHVLGLACEANGGAEDAERFLAKACNLSGQTALYWKDLGRVYLSRNHFDAALAALDRSLSLDASDTITHYLRGQACSSLKRYTDAIDSFGVVLQRQPESAPALNSLGNVMRAIDRLVEAMDLYRMALKVNPEHMESWHNLGVIHALRKEWKESAACEAAAVTRRPQFWQAYVGLGLALSQQKLYDDAEPCFHQALAIAGDKPDILIELGNLAAGRQNGAEAMEWYRRAMNADPNYVGAFLNAAGLLRINGALEEALSLSEHVRQLDPTNTNAHNMIGNCLSELGRVREALGSFQSAVELDPADSVAHSNLLYNLNFHTAFGRGQIATLHAAWGRMEERRVQNVRVSPRTRPDLRKRLRIGYVSADFRRHSVMYFLAPILRRHARDECEIYCFSSVDREDEVTRQVRQMGIVWRDITAMPDMQACRQIVDDEIDILVDLAGHTGGNRLGIFAHKPAPVQCTYLGYPNTTGLRSIDYRIVDAITDPLDTADPYCTEALVRLPRGFLCFSEPDLASEPGSEDQPQVELRLNPELPEKRHGRLTFGTFNNNKKIDAETIRLWGRLLSAFPEAQILLKGRAFRNREVRETIHRRFAQEGVSSDRILLRIQQRSLAEHLNQYNDVDIALDTYPYNGTTTTFEALWMGVPVVTVCGESHASRVGASILTTLGHPEWVAHNDDEFVEACRKIIANRDRRSALRLGLREELRKGNLMDESGFVLQLEAFYREAWRRYCEQQSLAV